MAKTQTHPSLFLPPEPEARVVSQLALIVGCLGANLAKHPTMEAIGLRSEALRLRTGGKVPKT